MQAETLQAHILGLGPLPTNDAINLVDDARTDLYIAIQTTDGTVLKFGRTRRLASALQRLALALREHGTCAWPGCDITWNRCDADHDPPWDQGGLTNLDTMRLLCTNGHHTHRHETNNNITRQPNSPWTINNEQPEPRPPTPPASPPSRPRHARTPESTQEGHERLHQIRCRLRQTARDESAEGDGAEAPTNSSEEARPDGAEAPTNS